MDDSEVVAILRRQIEAAQEAGPRDQDFIDAQAYYYGRPRGDEIPGRSITQSLDVADMTNAMLAQIIPTFTQDAICQFEPDAPGDEAQCRLESDAVNKVMMESSRGFVVFYEAVKDGLLFKNGIVKAYLEEADEGRYLRLKAIDPANFIVGTDTDCILMYETRFCAERKQYSRAQLLEMGFSRADIETIPCEDEDTWVYNRKRRQGITPATDLTVWANELVIIWECYSQLPEDQDGGKTKLYRCLMGGQTLLLKEEADYLPYAAGTPFIEPHNFWGLSLFDRLRTVQDTKTAISRQWLDSLANCNNSRTAINDRVNFEDYKTGRPGGAVRIEGSGPVGDALMPLPVIDAGPAAQAYLAYMDQVRADRGGAVLQMASGEAQVASAQIGSMGVDRIFSVQEQLSAMIARTFAETLMRSAFMLIHRMLRLELKEPMTLRLADQWVQVNPAEWRPRMRVNIKSGLSPGERSRKAAALAQILSIQAQALQGGLDGVNVSMQNIHACQLDLCSALEVEAGERYFMDPSSQAAQQAAKGKMDQGQQQQQLMMQLEQAKLQIEQGKQAIEQQKLQLDKYKTDYENRIKVWTEQLHAEIEEAKLVGAATADLQRVELEGRYQAEAARNTESQGATTAGA